MHSLFGLTLVSWVELSLGSLQIEEVCCLLSQWPWCLATRCQLCSHSHSRVVTHTQSPAPQSVTVATYETCIGEMTLSSYYSYTYLYWVWNGQFPKLKHAFCSLWWALSHGVFRLIIHYEIHYKAKSANFTFRLMVQRQKLADFGSIKHFDINTPWDKELQNACFSFGNGHSKLKLWALKL